jgi:hypothetical protein
MKGKEVFFMESPPLPLQGCKQACSNDRKPNPKSEAGNEGEHWHEHIRSAITQQVTENCAKKLCD